jgi:hypothetical protein
MNRPLLTCWIALGFIFVAWASFQVLQSEVPWNSEVAAAWVQAIGSLLALLIAIAVPAWQSYRSEKMTLSDRRRRELGFLTAAYGAISEAAGVAVFICQLASEEPESFDVGMLEQMASDAIATLGSIPSHDMPDAGVMGSLKLARISITHIKPLIIFTKAHIEAGTLSESHKQILRNKADTLLARANDIVPLLAPEVEAAAFHYDDFEVP